MDGFSHLERSTATSRLPELSPVNYVGVTLPQGTGQPVPATPPANGPTNPAVLPADRIDPGDGSLLVRILTYLGFGRRATRSRKSFVSMLWNLFWGFSQVIKEC